jgi:hypothetical protein
MRGQHVGSLNVIVRRGDNANETVAWSRRGTQGNLWIAGRVDFDVIKFEPREQSTTLVFEGRRGNGFLGDIALDDVSVTDGACAATFSPSHVFSCSFERDSCGMTDDTTQPVKWKRRNNQYSGPQVDHTVNLYILTTFLFFSQNR